MKAFLTQKNAQLRAESIESNVTYRLYLNLRKGDDFNGFGHYLFKLKKTENVFLDFCGKKIDSFEINSVKLTEEQITQNWQNGSFTLSPQHLKANAQNEVKFTFSNQYYKDGNGIHTFVDADGGQYTYCQSEPFWINKVYPVFDQPDIKGKMSFVIQAPNDWRVISNTNVVLTLTGQEFADSSKTKNDFENLVTEWKKADFGEHAANTLVHVFNETPLLSTYLYNFVSGPFEAIPYAGEDGQTIPMTIYCRKSEIEYAHAQKRYIFLFVKKGIEFYEGLFQTKYPFEKYDTIFCPEFTVGAMEYPGAITFSDVLLFKDKEPNTTQISNFGRVTIHELAHMWFGNLVTMKWWDDLWLNESFADFSCYMAMTEINKTMPNMDLPDGFVMFLQRKFWGYSEDELITTHPIACEVVSTDTADSLFDGITYAKGAAVLKQLYFLLGKTQFSLNLKRYFKKYEWSNASLHDFLAEMKVQTESPDIEKFDMDKFSKQWIEQAGTNVLSAHWDPTHQGKSELIIHQKPVLQEHPTLRLHKIQIAFLKEDGSYGEEQTVMIHDAPETKINFENHNYKALILNHEDWDFVKIDLDPHSLEFFKQHLLKVPSWTSKLLVLRSFFDMVKNGDLKSTEFVNMIDFSFIEAVSKNPYIFGTVLSFVNAAIQTYTPAKFRNELCDLQFDNVLKLIHQSDKKDIIAVAKGYLIHFAKSDKSIRTLKKIYLQKHPVHDKVTLILDDKFSLFFKLHESSGFTEKVKDMFKDHLVTSDNTATKELHLARLEASTATENKLDEMWAKVSSTDRDMSYTKMSYFLQGLTKNTSKSNRKQEIQKKYPEWTLDLIEKDQKKNAMTYMEGVLMSKEDLDLWIEELTKLQSKLDEKHSHFRTSLGKEIESMKKRKRAYALFE